MKRWRQKDFKKRISEMMQQIFRISKKETAAAVDAAYQAYDAEWADLVIDLVEQKLQTIGHEETTSLAVQVVLQDETWSISDDSMTNIDTAMITYP